MRQRCRAESGEGSFISVNIFFLYSGANDSLRSMLVFSDESFARWYEYRTEQETKCNTGNDSDGKARLDH
jgi:hypothetical protein